MEWQKGDVVKIESDDVLNYVLVLNKVIKRRSGNCYTVYNISTGNTYCSYLCATHIDYTLHSRNNEQL